MPLPYAPPGGPAFRVAAFLLSTQKTVVMTGDLIRECGIRTDNATQVLGTKLVREALRMRGWFRTTRRMSGLRGKGRMFIRTSD